jgi:hypothetical protein
MKTWQGGSHLKPPPEPAPRQRGYRAPQADATDYAGQERSRPAIEPPESRGREPGSTVSGLARR